MSDHNSVCGNVKDWVDKIVLVVFEWTRLYWQFLSGQDCISSFLSGQDCISSFLGGQYGIGSFWVDKIVLVVLGGQDCIGSFGWTRLYWQFWGGQDGIGSFWKNRNRLFFLYQDVTEVDFLGCLNTYIFQHVVFGFCDFFNCLT